jgi:hypothetical protein
MRAEPSAGRYFPIAPPRLLAMTRNWRLTGEPQPRKFRAPEGAEEPAHLLARLRPGLDLTVFSLSADVDRSSGERAIAKAIEMLAPRNATPAEHVDGHSRAILVYLHNCEQLRLIDEHVRFRRRKFGAGEGLSSSRKPIVTSRTRTELASVALFD